MDPVYEKLKRIREREDLSLKKEMVPNLRETFVAVDGKEHELKLRYYQVQGVLHLVSMNRFLLGDDTGLGKCVTGDTLVVTDRGLMPIKDLRRDLQNEPDPGKFTETVAVKVWTGTKWARVKSFYFDGVKPTLQIQTRYGFQVEGTYKHPLWVRSSQGEEWKRLPELNLGDYLCVERREVAWPENEFEVCFSDSRPAPSKRYETPKTVTPELGRLLGYFVAEGNSATKYGFTITQCDSEAQRDIRKLLKVCFGWEGNHSRKNASEEIVVSSAMLRDYLDAVGAHHAKSESKSVPWTVMRSPREVVRQFLRGLFEGDGHALGQGVEYTTKSLSLAQEVQVLLLRFGIVARLAKKPVQGENYWRLTVFGEDARAFRDKIGFVTERKTQVLASALSDSSNSNHDVVPHINDLVGPLWNALKEATPVQGNNSLRFESNLKQFGEVLRNITYPKLRELLAHARDFNLTHLPEYQALHDIVERNYFYDPITCIRSGSAEVMDLEVADSDHSFVGNGLIHHNTIQTIASLCVKWKSNPNQKAIILAPKSAISQWASEFEKFTHGVHTFQALGGPKKRQKVYKEFLSVSGPSVLILNYERARIDFRTLQKWKNYFLVCDESSKFKNPKSHIYQVVRHLSQQAKACWCLTATLIKNNLVEGYAIIECMLPGTFGVLNQFMKHYCRTRKQSRGRGKGYVRVISGYTNKHIKAFKTRIDPVFLSRAKHDVASELPVLTTRRIIVGMNRQQKMKYDQALAGLITIDKERYDEEGNLIHHIETDKLTALQRCQQIVDHPELVDCEGTSEKLENLVDLLENDFDGDKVIVFTKYSKMVDLMMPVLKKKGFNPVRITGTENDTARKAAMKQFQDPKSDVKVICITIAASEAINLQSAKGLIFYDLPWSAGDYLQTLGRMIRIGSAHERCYAVHLLTEDSIDLYVEKVLNDKMNLIEKVIGKRIKGEKDETKFVSQENDISNIYNMMVSEAVKK